MSRDNPLPLTVIVAVRWEDDVLALAVTVIVLLFEPEDIESENQVAPFRKIVQLVLEVIVNVFDSFEDEKFNEEGDTDKVIGTPVCVTFISRVILPPLTVMNAVR